MRIAVQNVSKHFGTFTALDDVSLQVPEGKLVALLGPSGSGKTTLLRIIAGLEAPDSGQVLYADDDVTRRGARERNVGFVFQHYALFGHMNVFENVAFGLRVRKWKQAQITRRVHELLDLVQLRGMEKRLPSQLSGGQRQRIALARALASEPRVLLLDEPFGALDAKVRDELRRWIRQLHDEIHMTSLFVTHDQEEAFEVADYVVVMNRGRIAQQGTPDDVFEHPANAFVTDFLGRVNVFRGRVQNGRAQLGGQVSLPFSSPSSPEGQSEGESLGEGAEVTAYIRPHEVDLGHEKHGPDSMFAIVTRVNRSGATVKVALVAQDGQLPLDVEITRERDAQLNLKAGDTIWVFPRQIRVFAAENGAASKGAATSAEE